jgi:signal transduction histidine kinase
MSDNPERGPVLDQMDAAARTKMTELAKTIELQASGQHEAAVALVQSDDGFKSMNGLRLLVERTLADEERLLLARSAASRRNDARLLAVSLAGMALVVLIGALSVFLVQRTSRQRESARNELAATNANLERIVAHRTADLTEANEEIQRFAYIVSHDLRSPLVNIMGFTSELEELRGDIFRRIAALGRAAISASPPPMVAGEIEPVLDGEDKQLSQDFAEALGFIKSSIAKMDRLISAILNLTREGRREFEPVRIETRELIAGIVATVAHQAAEAEAQIRVEPLPAIVSDRLALEQIFSNLIDNALKYLKPGVPGDISVRGRTKLGFAIFEIADNGRGIDPKDHQRIFDLFRRAGTQDRPGQGIGLAHVRTLVRRLGGTMSVASELHSGSTFTITLPINWTASKRNRDS